jgi:hypothetical protein
MSGLAGPAALAAPGGGCSAGTSSARVAAAGRFAADGGMEAVVSSLAATFGRGRGSGARLGAGAVLREEVIGAVASRGAGKPGDGAGSVPLSSLLEPPGTGVSLRPTGGGIAATGRGGGM